VITAGDLLVMAEVLRVERLVPEARSAEEPSGRPGTGQLGIPVARSTAGTTELSGRADALLIENVSNSVLKNQRSCLAGPAAAAGWPAITYSLLRICEAYDRCCRMLSAQFLYSSNDKAAHRQGKLNL